MKTHTDSHTGQYYNIEKKIRKGEIDPNTDIITSLSEKSVYLPIEEFSKELIYTIEKSDVTIVIGETGCGKTTKIPEFLYKSNSNVKIAHILPRKIASITVAKRVAKNMWLTLGKEVGYSVRFDYNYSKDTKIKFLTEGMFIRELLIDPLLSSYNVVIIDDCHERTINSELIMGFLKKILVLKKQKKLDDLKVIISSATLDYECYLKFFSSSIENIKIESNIFVITGRTYPVDIFYLDKPIKNYIESAVITAANIHKYNERNSGDILVFMTGQEDINLFIEYSSSHGLDRKDVLILPLYAGLAIERQLEVFQPTPHNKRKIVVSTNIAEASVTIDNIAYVIDCCLVKMKFFNTKNDSDALYIIPASKFSLDQRAGRAGRTRPGQCYRFIRENEYDRLYLMTNPELLRSNLREFVLRLKSMGIKDLSKFETITEPDKNTIARALESFYYLGIVDDKTNLTEFGVKVCDLPIDIRLAVALFKSAELKFSCVEDVLIIVSMLSIPNLFYQPKEHSNLLKAKQRVGVIQGDHLTLLSIYRQYKNCKTGRSKFCKDIYLNENLMKQVDDMIHNLKPYLNKYEVRIKSSLDTDGEDILKSFLKGFFLNVAQKQADGSYRSLRWNIPLHIHPTSVLYTIMPEYVLYNEVTCTAKNYMTDVSQIEKPWIMEVASHFYEDKTKKVIQERHKDEVKVQYKQVVDVGRGQEDKRSINKVVEKSQEMFRSNITVGGDLNSNISNVGNVGNVAVVKKSTRVSLNLDMEKNKDFSDYFHDMGKEQGKAVDKSDNKKIDVGNINKNLLTSISNISEEKKVVPVKFDANINTNTKTNVITPNITPNITTNVSANVPIAINVTTNEDDIEEITMLRRMRKRK